jgi:chemotaxis protein MotB
MSDWEQKHGVLAQQKADADHHIEELDKKIVDLESEMAVYQESVASKTKEFQDKLAERKSEIEALRKQRAQIEANLKQYRGLREAFEKMIGAGELEVYRRHGRIMVALPSSVLFASGKADLSAPGQRAVAQVAQVLAKLEGRRFLVAGHTDNVPIRASRFQDNWDLSAARATMVTRTLIENGMPPTSVAAAGYGEHDPLKANDSSDNRKRNRRIEIILMPNIDELPELPEVP